MIPFFYILVDACEMLRSVFASGVEKENRPGSSN